MKNCKSKPKGYIRYINLINYTGFAASLRSDAYYKHLIKP